MEEGKGNLHKRQQTKRPEEHWGRRLRRPRPSAGIPTGDRPQTVGCTKLSTIRYSINSRLVAVENSQLDSESGENELK